MYTLTPRNKNGKWTKEDKDLSHRIQIRKEDFIRVYLYKKPSGITSKQYYSDDGRTYMRSSRLLVKREGIQPSWKKTDVYLEVKNINHLKGER